MYRFVVSNSLNRRTIMVDGNKTVQELFDEAGIEIGHATPNINGRLIRDVNTVIDTLDLDPNGTYRIDAIEKADNAAKMTIKGNAVSVESSFKLETLKEIAKYDNSQLYMTNEQGEPLFVIATTSGNGTLNNWSAEFGEYTDQEGHALINMLLDLPEENADEYVLNRFSQAIYKLNEMEENLKASGIVEKMAAFKDKINELVTFE